jgi:hypothetical protein
LAAAVFTVAGAGTELSGHSTLLPVGQGPIDALRMAVMMTAAASVTFFRPEFGDFLYAPIGADRDEMPLTVLSALTRLDVDPWKEAAELSELPRDTATQRLAALIARLPGGRWAQADARAIADGLIELLPHRGSSKPLSADKFLGLQGLKVSPMVLICAALGVASLIFAATFQRSTRSDATDAPDVSTASPPQTSRPSSR